MRHLRLPLIPAALRLARRVRGRAPWLVAALFAWLVALIPATRAGAQATVLGAQDCEKCHKAALKKWKLEEPAQLGPKAHASTHKQLSDPKAAKFAAAIGQADPLAPQGRCAACHATIVRGIIRVGVSCESCHGPASLYNPVHDKEPLAESYKKSIPLGLRDLHAKPAAIAALCVGCHVTPEKALAAAGHPSGAEFDAGASLKKLVHWTSAFTGDASEHAAYDYAQVAAAARPLVQKALAGGGGAPKPVVPKPAASAPGAGLTAGTPAGASASPAATSAPAAPAPSRRPPPAAPPGPPAPWDWDQPVAPLPDDYPSETAPAAAAGATPAPAAPEATPVAPPTRAPRAPRLPGQTPSIAPDQPALPIPAIVTPAAAPAASASAPSATSKVAALRGQAAALLARLLAQGRRAPDLAPARKPQEFNGPDSELLNIQEIAFYLALETLRQGAPATGAASRQEAP